MFVTFTSKVSQTSANSPLMALLSNADLCLLNELLLVSSVFWSSYKLTSLRIIVKYLTYVSFTT